MATNFALNSLAVAVPAVAVAVPAATVVDVVDSAADVVVVTAAAAAADVAAAWAAVGTESETLVVPITDVSYRDYLHLVSYLLEDERVRR